ncbi:MAG: hypothetical protein WEB58_22940 [Planctomycetaceae bacterium]
MLSDSQIVGSHGGFVEDLHLKGTARYELFDFVTGELPRWRNHSERTSATSETVLTSTLCAHLNSAARFSDAWNRIQFLPEEPDETWQGRKIDFAPKPLGALIFIEGRRHTLFDKLFPIECKRLPIPKGNDRDEWEYVISRKGSTGGIQRFKEGHHGAAHEFGGMIGYVQEGSPENWLAQINNWISELVAQSTNGWDHDDKLRLLKPNNENRVSQYSSHHRRPTVGSDIELRHSWVTMN